MRIVNRPVNNITELYGIVNKTKANFDEWRGNSQSWGKKKRVLDSCPRRVGCRGGRRREGKGGVGAAVNLSSGQHPVSWGPTLGILSPGFLARCLTLMVIAGLLPRYHPHPQPYPHHYPTPLGFSPSCSQDCRPQEQRGTARWTWAYPTCVSVAGFLSLHLFGVLELLLDFCVLMIFFFSIAATPFWVLQLLLDFCVLMIFFFSIAVTPFWVLQLLLDFCVLMIFFFSIASTPRIRRARGRWPPSPVPPCFVLVIRLQAPRPALRMSPPIPPALVMTVRSPGPSVSFTSEFPSPHYPHLTFRDGYG